MNGEWFMAHGPREPAQLILLLINLIPRLIIKGIRYPKNQTTSFVYQSFAWNKSRANLDEHIGRRRYVPSDERKDATAHYQEVKDEGTN